MDVVVVVVVPSSSSGDDSSNGSSISSHSSTVNWSASNKLIDTEQMNRQRWRNVICEPGVVMKKLIQVAVVGL